MAKPKKTAAAEDALARLRGVNRAAGYQTNLGRNRGGAVGRRMLKLNALRETDFPAGTVLMAEAGPDPDDECLGPSEAERANLVVVLYGKAEDIPAELERLEADAKMALHGQTLEGTTGPLEHVSTIPYYQEEANPDRGMVEVTFRFSFYWTAAAP